MKNILFYFTLLLIFDINSCYIVDKIRNLKYLFKSTNKIKTVAILSIIINSITNYPISTEAKEELPSLSKIFNAVRKELSSDGESLNRLKTDINNENWSDILTYTREYDAGFRGGVLKSAWKQLGDQKKKGIELSNSFTFDLIALNKAARVQNKDEALLRLEQVKQDLIEFEKLDPAK